MRYPCETSKDTSHSDGHCQNSLEANPFETLNDGFSCQNLRLRTDMGKKETEISEPSKVSAVSVFTGLPKQQKVMRNHRGG